MNKLKGNKKINLLFEKGKSVKHFPFRLVYLEHEEVSWGVSVGKKAFALAVDRNKIKRRLREILRKNDGVFKKNGFGWYMIIYTHSSFVDFDILDKDVCSLFKK